MLVIHFCELVMDDKRLCGLGWHMGICGIAMPVPVIESCGAWSEVLQKHRVVHRILLVTENETISRMFSQSPQDPLKIAARSPQSVLNPGGNRHQI